MIKNYLKIAFRNLLKNKTQSIILIGGFTIGMTACILLLQDVSFELSYDNFHAEKDSIYRVVNQRLQNGQSTQKGAITYPTIGPTMKAEFPEVKNATRIAYSSNLMVTLDNLVDPVESGLWVDKHFFEIFNFELLAKNGHTILDEPNEVVISHELADRYFPNNQKNYEDLIDQEIRINQYPDPFKIVGICKSPPANSSLDFDLLISYASCIRYWGEGADNSWTWSDFYHYLQLEPNTDVAALEAKFTGFSKQHFRETEVSGSKEIFSLQALSDIHLYSGDLEYEINRTVNGKAVWSLLIIAFFILLLAWINYINLSSVKAIERSAEVGVRKVVGATRTQLITQFLTEAAFVNITSLFLAIAIVQIVNPWFSSNFGIDASILSLLDPSQANLLMISTLFGLLFLGMLISGAYPAWLLSSPMVSNVLKGNFNKQTKGTWLRKGLVIFQFTMSIGLITASWLESNQINFMSKQDLGINIDQVVTINPPEMSQWDSTFIQKMNTFKSELSKIPGIKSAATSSRAPGDQMGRVFQIQKLGESKSDQRFTSNFINADFEYAKTYGIVPVAGRFFEERDHNYDFNLVDKVVITEATAKMFSYNDFQSAINQKISFFEKEWKIIGVIPDFHQRSLHHGIEPIIFVPSYSTGNLLSLNMDANNIDLTLAQVKSSYDSYFPGNSFQYTFLDEHFKNLYEADIRFGKVLSFFTLLAILIACLGLFGLASYMTFLRTKEVGIRKVLGASVTGIIVLLSKDLIKLVFIALLIAIPISYIFMNQWLESFPYHIDLKWWVFLLAGLTAILLAFLTISFQSAKSAFMNPVEKLRNN